nr:hypothetical protein [Campylobacter jejuni]
MKCKKCAKKFRKINKFSDFFELSDELFCPYCKAKYRLNFIANLIDILFMEIFSWYFVLFCIVLLGLFFGDFSEIFELFLQIGMILVPLRMLFIFLVPFHLENSFLGKTFYFLENLFCLVFAILLIATIIIIILEIPKMFF